MASLLLIDDCPDFRAWARCVLEREGFTVIEARDALAGLQRAVEDAPDCIVVAEDLSGLDGLDVAARLADEPATRGLPVLVAGEATDPERRRRAQLAGARGRVLRTGRAGDLVAAVCAALLPVGISDEPARQAQPVWIDRLAG